MAEHHQEMTAHQGKTAHQGMTAFAYYRQPYLHHATYVAQHEGEPEVFSSVAELNGKEGFVIAPFSPSSDCPVLLIHPDETKLLAIEEEPSIEGNLQEPSYDGDSKESSHDSGSKNGVSREFPREESELSGDKKAYAEDFECFHRQLENNRFDKIVLARKASMQTHIGAKALFMRACRLYPRLFVALVYTPQSGMWLMATPEILLKGDGCDFSTMSLAGTQKAEPSRTVADYPVEGVEWSVKNQEEQQYVTDYIEQCIKTFTDDYSLKGPYTTMAANLYHLRTDIAFRLRDTLHLGDVLESLYPTPAVCGIPKAETREFILRHEHQPRKYYSGFVGPLMMKGKTNLFVSLRCMNILLEDGSGHHRPHSPKLITCELYAGGGLLKESEMEKEWNETEAKMQTIKKVIKSV